MDSIDDVDTYRRMVRLVVYDNIEEKLYDSHVPHPNRTRTNTIASKMVHYGSPPHPTIFGTSLLASNRDLH